MGTLFLINLGVLAGLIGGWTYVYKRCKKAGRTTGSSHVFGFAAGVAGAIAVPLSIAVVLGISGVVPPSGPSNGASSQSGGETAHAEEPAAPTKAVFKIGAVALFDGYEENEVAMDERMKGQAIEVTGVIQSIDKDFANDIVLKLGTRNEFMPVNLTLVSSEKSKAMALRKGRKIVVQCEKMMRVMGSPAGEACLIQG